MQTTLPSTTNRYALVIIGILYFTLGFVTWLNGTLIQYLKIACELSDYESLFVASAFYISYFVMALPSSFILQKTGFKKGMMLGLLVMAAGALLFILLICDVIFIFFIFENNSITFKGIFGKNISQKATCWYYNEKHKIGLDLLKPLSKTAFLNYLL